MIAVNIFFLSWLTKLNTCLYIDTFLRMTYLQLLLLRNLNAISVISLYFLFVYYKVDQVTSQIRVIFLDINFLLIYTIV